MHLLEFTQVENIYRYNNSIILSAGVNQDLIWRLPLGIHLCCYLKNNLCRIINNVKQMSENLLHFLSTYIHIHTYDFCEYHYLKIDSRCSFSRNHTNSSVKMGHNKTFSTFLSTVVWLPNFFHLIVHAYITLNCI